MITVLNVLFSTTFMYACVNGGILRTQGITGGSSGSWQGAVGYPGAPAIPDSPATWTGSVTYTGASGVAGWPEPAGHSGAQAPVGYTGPTAVPSVQPDGTIADVPEVSAARAAHLVALQIAYADPRSADGDNGDYNVYKYGDDRYFQYEHPSGSPVRLNGLGGQTFQDAAAWKAKYSAENQHLFPNLQSGSPYATADNTLSLLIAKNAAAAATPSGASAELVMPYVGPLATAQVLASGYLADTVDVNAARLHHLKALAETKATADPWAQKNVGWN